MKLPAFILLLSSLVAVADIELARDGIATALIVVPGKPSRVARDAAAELQAYLQRISGAQFAIKSETALSSSERSSALILVGSGELVRQAGVNVAALKPEGFVVKTFGQRLILAGRDDAVGSNDSQGGTRLAVSDFLELELGVRWLWPGASGEVVPVRKTIAIKAIDRSDAPKLLQRKLRNEIATSPERKGGKVREALALDPKRHEEMKRESEAWLVRQRCGASLNLNYGHAFTSWHERYAEEHPDFFAMQANGSRAWPESLGGPERAKICVSNPNVLNQWLANAEDAFARSPQLGSFSASPNDNAYNGHCLCLNCRAWDVPGAPTVELNSVGADGARTTFEYPALTERYVRFYNLAAERLAQIAPGKWVGGYAYGAWKTPPLRERVRDNVIIGFVGFNVPMVSDDDRAMWDAWTKTAPHFFLRPNLLHYGHGYPLLYPHWLGQVIRYCADTGMLGCDFDSIEHNWATQGLNYYVLAKLIWNPHADVETIIKDYCEKGFGPAAPAVRACFDALEAHTKDLSRIITSKSRDFDVASVSLHTPERFAAWQKHLDRAKQLAASDKAVLERIRFLETGLEYGRIHSTVTREFQAAQADGKFKSSPALEAAFAARNKFYREQLGQFSIGIPSIAWREIGRRNYGFDVAAPTRKPKTSK